MPKEKKKKSNEVKENVEKEERKEKILDISRYPLFFTLFSEKDDNKEISLSEKSRNKIIKKIQEEKTEDQKKAMIGIICQYAITKENFTFSATNIKLPFGGIQKNDDVVFDMSKFPDSLLITLSKFCELQIIKKKTT